MGFERVGIVAILAFTCTLLATPVVADVPNPKVRIVRGHSANEGQFPYQVALVSRVSEYASALGGGSLIGEEWVLTAAHVVDGALDVTVKLGTLYRDLPEVQYTVGPDNVIINSGWDTKTLHNDIALVRIPRVTYSSTIAPIKLPPLADKSSFAGDAVILSGWGRSSNDSPLPQPLQYGNAQVLSQQQCARSLALVPSMLCASSSGSATCNGDSGGPLVLQEIPIQVGIVSFVVNGCESGLPNGYTRVTSFTEWIRDHTGIQY